MFDVTGHFWRSLAWAAFCLGTAAAVGLLHHWGETIFWDVVFGVLGTLAAVNAVRFARWAYLDATDPPPPDPPGG